jgi:hypothetical protein
MRDMQLRSAERNAVRDKNEHKGGRGFATREAGCGSNLCDGPCDPPRVLLLTKT